MKLEDSRARWEEEVDIILLALQGKPFRYEGEYYQIPLGGTTEKGLYVAYAPTAKQSAACLQGAHVTVYGVTRYREEASDAHGRRREPPVSGTRPCAGPSR